MGGRKTVKLRESTWRELRLLMQPGETFDDVVRRLVGELSECRRRVRELERRVGELEGELARSASGRVDPAALDRAAWHAVKLAFAVQALKDAAEDPMLGGAAARRLEWVLKALDQIREWYKVRVEEAKRVAERFYVEPSREARMLLNEVTKEVVKSVVLRVLGLEPPR